MKETKLNGRKITLKIDRLAYGGDGVGHYEGKVVFVPLSAPGDELEVLITNDQKRFAKGRLVRIVEPSPERIEARCDVFGRCGGCQWQHMDYSTQVKHKAQIFHETLCHLGGFTDPPIEPIIPADPIWEYRERIQVKVNPAGEVGFFAHGTHEVVPFDYCHISHPYLNDVLKQDRTWSENVELAWNAAQQQVEIHREDQGSFAQIHPKQNERLVETVLDFVGPDADEQILELYCGNGNFSLPLAARAGSVYAVDKNPKAVGRALRTARDQGLANVTFEVANAEWALKQAKRRSPRPSTLLVDPPRGGVKDILDLIALFSVHQIVYISCDPAALARDLKFLAGKGYRLDRVRPLDMFPQTYHIESVARLIHA